MQTATPMRRGPHAQRHRRISRWGVARENVVSQTKRSCIHRRHRPVTTSHPVSEASKEWPVEAMGPQDWVPERVAYIDATFRTSRAGSLGPAEKSCWNCPQIRSLVGWASRTRYAANFQMTLGQLDASLSSQVLTLPDPRQRRDDIRAPDRAEFGVCPGD